MTARVTAGAGLLGSRARDLGRRRHGSPYGVHNLPYGVFAHDGGLPTHRGTHRRLRASTCAGPRTADRYRARGTLGAPTLNPFMALGRPAWDAVRARLTELLDRRRDSRDVLTPLLVPLRECEMRLPFEVADYVDFYSSEHHAANVGQIFRPGSAAADAELEAPADRVPRPGRHGGGVRHRRSCARRGQRRRPATDAPTFGPSHAAGHRGRGRLRGRRADRARRPGRASTTSPTTSSASCWSTTGPPATSRPGSTCRSARSSASRSPPRSPPGWCRWPRWSTPASRPGAGPAGAAEYLTEADRNGLRPVS